MPINDHIPVLTDLIEKGIEIRLSELGLDELGIDHNEDLILEADEREEPQIDEIDTTRLEFEAEPIQDPLSDNPALEQAIRRILDEHMELALQEIKLAISQIPRDKTE